MEHHIILLTSFNFSSNIFDIEIWDLIGKLLSQIPIFLFFCCFVLHYLAVIYSYDFLQVFNNLSEECHSVRNSVTTQNICRIRKTFILREQISTSPWLPMESIKAHVIPVSHLASLHSTTSSGSLAPKSSMEWSNSSLIVSHRILMLFFYGWFFG